MCDLSLQSTWHIQKISRKAWNGSGCQCFLVQNGLLFGQDSWSFSNWHARVYGGVVGQEKVTYVNWTVNRCGGAMACSEDWKHFQTPLLLHYRLIDVMLSIGKRIPQLKFSVVQSKADAVGHADPDDSRVWGNRAQQDLFLRDSKFLIKKVPLKKATIFPRERVRCPY